MKKWILVGIAVITIIVVASLFNSQKPKFTAEEYFNIFVTYHDEDLENPEIMFVTLLILEIQPVKGDATEAYITNLPGNTVEQSLETIPMGQNKTVTIQFNYAAACPRKAEGYALSFTLGCSEAYGRITIYLQPLNQSSS